MNDKNLHVRVKACWSLGNLCDTISKLPNSEEHFAPLSLIELIRTALRASTDNDKVRSNAVRALGNFSRSATPRMLTNDGILDKIVDTLFSCISLGSVKVRWNSCYAIGNLLRNSYVQNNLSNYVWSSAMFQALLDVIGECRNFKIRINAASALAIPNKRIHYGSSYPRIWEVLSDSLENLDENSNFEEFKYRETLEQQLVLTFAHIISLLDVSDTAEVHSIEAVIEKKARSFWKPLFVKWESFFAKNEKQLENGSNDKHDLFTSTLLKLESFISSISKSF